MSCSDCEQAQKQGDPKTYFRIENANIELVGCEEHLEKAVKQLRRGAE